VAKSPTQCTLDKWRRLGYLCWVVEKWNSHAGIRQDMFGFIDVLAIKEGETVAIQSTSKPNVLARVKKIESDELFGAVNDVRKAGWRIVAEGWFKPGSRWECKEIELT
jgi:hypothetical protein